jgi:thiol-disulfide isomerase/thioredoxin
MKIVLSIVLLLGSLFSLNGEAHDHIENKAPNWELLTQAGENISLADYQGQPVILHFWATWCPYCKKLQPQDSIKERGYNFITAVNGDEVAEEYGVKGTPTTFFINRHGVVIFKSTSSNIDDPRLDLAVQEIIKAK